MGGSIGEIGACRANWGREDDYLGGLVDADGHPFPVYHAYRLYAGMTGQTRVATEGNNRTIACLASRDEGRLEVLLGSVAQGSRKVVLELQGLGTQPLQSEVRFIPNTNLDEPLAASDIPVLKQYSCERHASMLRVTLDNVAENQAYHVVLRPAGR